MRVRAEVIMTGQILWVPAGLRALGRQMCHSVLVDAASVVRPEAILLCVCTCFSSMHAAAHRSCAHEQHGYLCSGTANLLARQCSAPFGNVSSLCFPLVVGGTGRGQFPPTRPSCGAEGSRGLRCSSLGTKVVRDRGPCEPVQLPC